MARLQNYMKENAGNRGDPVSLRGSGILAVVDTDEMERELKRIEQRMYHARDRQNWSQYEKFKKDYEALASQAKSYKTVQKDGEVLKKILFKQMTANSIEG
jgi:hypothetical protein